MGWVGSVLALCVACSGRLHVSHPLPPPVEHFVILHTNDLHSHLQGHAPEPDYTPGTTGDDATVGGFSRLATVAGSARAAAKAAGKPVLLLDAGDFMMGTPFSLLGTSQAAELKLMDALGYDATTLGNHELDWTPKGLAAILQAAKMAGVKLPILASNLKFDAKSPDDDALEAFKDPGPIKTKIVKTIGHLKVGIFGLMGSDAAAVTPTAKPLTFEDIATAAARVTADLRNNDKVDVVVALSHAGIAADGTGEDQVLATKVPDLDVSVSGHTHDVLKAPVKVGKTLIVTAGEFGEHLGQLELSARCRARPASRSTSTRCSTSTTRRRAIRRRRRGSTRTLPASTRRSGLRASATRRSSPRRPSTWTRDKSERRWAMRSPTPTAR